MAGEHTFQGAQRLARLLVHPPDPRDCERCLDALEDYCAAQIAGGDTAAQFSQVAEHLDRCVACAEAYALVYESLLAGANVPEPASPPRVDLGFLAPQGPTWNAIGATQQALDDAIDRGTAYLRIVLSQALLELMPPAPAASALRSAADPTALFDATWPAPGSGVDELQISALPARSENRCDMRVRVALTGRAWPDLEGITIRLHAGDDLRLATTDAWGEVLFTELPRTLLPGAEIEIEGYV